MVGWELCLLFLQNVPGAKSNPDSRVNLYLILYCKLKNGLMTIVVILNHQLSLNILSLNQDYTVCDLTD